jgi:hypothetical protein
MAQKRGFDNSEEKTSLPRRSRARSRSPGGPCRKAVWAVVLVCACVHGCRGPSASPQSMSLRAYDVRITRQSDTYRPRTYRAVLAADQRRCRIAVYWLDPPEESEPTDALAFSDFLFDADHLWYWHHKEKLVHALSLETQSHGEAMQLPTGKGFEPMLASILRLVVDNRAPAASSQGTTEASRFFHGTRENERLKHTAKPPPADATPEALLSRWAEGDGAVLDQLPFGRRYSKELDQEGNVVWRMSKAAVPMEKVSVTARPMPLCDTSGRSEIGDPSTLGRWSAVPEVYRRYWSLKDRGINLRRKPNVQEAQQLYADIRSALRGAVPDDVNAPLRELLFRASLQTESDDAMRSSARQYFSAYVRLAQEPVERIIIELGRIARELRARWPEDQTRDFVRPLLEAIVEPKVFGDTQFLEEDVLKWIHTHGATWSWYEQLVHQTAQEVTAVGIRSGAHSEQASGALSRPAAVPDSEPNHGATPVDARERE